VAECRSLRQQIYFFEQTFSQQHRRLPRSDERGSMAPAYSRYKEVKRFVRDQAAVDIQKAWRGFRCRRLGGFEAAAAAAAAAAGGGSGRGEPRRKGQRISVDSSDAAASIGIDAMSIGISRVGPAQPFAHAPALALATAPTSTALPLEVLQQCRSLQQEKREIKRRLKRFDEDFLRDHGRAPKKADKEVMRPVYQQYHDIKGRLDAMRRDIEASYGSFPAEADGDEGAHDGFYTSEEEGGASSSDRLSSLPALHSSPLAVAATAPSVSSATAATAPLPTVALGGAGVGTGVGAQHEQPSLAQLQEEKRTLHAHLKAYEREFQRTHGRQVMHQEDILPVSAEYRRYKDLKAWIKENT